MSMLRLTSGLLFFSAVGNCDQYLQNPKGSNNRLNEKSANRANGNRLFNSQNNNRGGYNVGETGEAGDAFNGGNNFGEGTTAQMWDPSNALNGQSYQYDMSYQEGSELRMTWTSQHGCGNAMNNCNMVIQFACDNNDKDSTNFGNFVDKGLGIRANMHNGGNTGTPNEPGANINNAQNTFNGNNGNNRGRHESEEYYAMCRLRERNKGLFTADQKLKGHSQIYTRQNPNGNRNGLECPEERDYYPHEFPSIWRDIAWIGNDVEYCKTNIAPFSQNVYAKGACTGGNANTLATTNDMAGATTPQECADEGGTWVTTSWGQTFTAAWAENFCQPSQWSQVNHLGNVDGTALGGQMASYGWTIPTAAELRSNYKCHEYTSATGPNYFRLVVRTRYNISTGDYDPYQTTAEMNNDPKNGVISPVTQNPTIDVGAYMQGLRLALNTAQTGRTFQDRSHIISVYEKPPAAGRQSTKSVLNVNVRGKRGNIVQTFPAMEYDFEPNDFQISRDQCIHFQWTGSNTHNNGNPAGDGQAGDAGEGAGGTDRSNLMEMQTMRGSYPMAYDVTANNGNSFFDHVDCKFAHEDGTDFIDTDQVKAIFATGGYYYVNNAGNLASNNGNDDVNPLLNNVSASFRQGLMCCTKNTTPAGDYYFLSTRNNNFTNRSQKMKITVVAGTAQTFEYYKVE